MLELPDQRRACFSSLQRILVRLDFEALTLALNAGSATAFASGQGEQIAPDGKGSKASVINYDSAIKP